MNGKNISDLVGQSKKKLEHFTKKDLIEILSNSQQEEVEDKVVRSSAGPEDYENMICFLDAKISDMEKNIIANLVSENEKLSNRCNDLEIVNNRLVKRVINMERSHWQGVQYSRRNNLEFVGIPADVSQEELEGSVIKILRSIEVEVQPEDIEACHRLEYGKNENKNEPKRTIVKFVNHKKCDYGMKNRKKLKDTDKSELGFNEETRIFINHNLCPYYRSLLGKCNYLKRKGLINSCWTFNGIVTLKIKENGPFSVILHDSDLFKMFPGEFQED